MVSLPLPPTAFSITTPFAMVNPPIIPLDRETKPPAFGPVNGAAFKSIMHASELPKLDIVSIPPASHIQDQKVPAPFKDGNK